VTRRSSQSGRAGRWQLGRRRFLTEFRCVTKRIAQIVKPFDPARPGGGQRRKVQGGRVSRGRLQVWLMATTTPLRIIPVGPSLRFASLPGIWRMKRRGGARKFSGTQWRRDCKPGQKLRSAGAER
jgi:hypothetical protein